MLTAHNEFSYVRDSLRYHADEYLWKPEVGFYDILDCMNRVLESRQKKMESEKNIYKFSDEENEEKNFHKKIFPKLLEKLNIL